MSWNVAYRTGASVKRQAEFLAKLRPDLVLLQEVNPRSSDVLMTESGLAWLVRSVDLRAAAPDDRPVRRRGVAIAGKGPRPEEVALLPGDIALPERALTACVVLDGGPMTALSYHAPPGVNWGIDKVRQAWACVRWLGVQHGPVVMGADGNTPEFAMPDFKDSRTHWHTGMRKLAGEPGDDILFGPNKRHRLTDALRTWLGQHPEEFGRIRTDYPAGPLALSHRTGRRRDSPGIDRRFDSIWLTPEFQVEGVAYPYQESIDAGSDHSAVVVDAKFQSTSSRQDV